MRALTPIEVRDLTIENPRSCGPGHFDIWLLASGIETPDRGLLEDVLSTEEQERARRFRLEADRVRCLVARGGLRRILSSYSGLPPQALQFETGDHGKPALKDSSFEFNISHSGDCVLIGVTAGVPCGVDIERGRANTSELAITERFFCPREKEWLSSTERGFLRLWTIKESIIKAVGAGLSIPLSDLDVTDVVQKRSSSITLHTSSMPPQTLWLSELQTVPGYAAAVATVGEERTIRLVSAKRS